MASEHAATLRREFSTADLDDGERRVEDRLRNPNRPSIFNIGRGTCGSVYAMSGAAKQQQQQRQQRAVKLGGNEKELLGDFGQTADAWQAVQRCGQMLADHFIRKGTRVCVPKVPRCYEFHVSCEDAIARHERTLSSEDESVRSGISEEERQKPGYLMERIPPVPTAARIALVKEVFDEDDQDGFLADLENEDCLIRLYFGKDESGGFIDTLRNFPLYSDQMDEIGLDTRILVTELAIGLAIIHWGAELDGMDVEFVLSASSAQSTAGSTSTTSRRGTHLWILDFDKATPVSLDGDQAELIRRLVVATSGNDPYFPRPSVNKERWDQFAGAYVDAGKKILEEKMGRMGTAAAAREGDVLGLPYVFIEALEAQFEMEDKSDDGMFVLFES